MTQQEKDLLLKDLCARLPYGVKILHMEMEEDCGSTNIYTVKNIDIKKGIVSWDLKVNGKMCVGMASCEFFKTYLRPMSSMTEEEKKELFQLMGCGNEVGKIDFYNSHHLDYRGLIPMGLALEASEEMYSKQ